MTSPRAGDRGGQLGWSLVLLAAVAACSSAKKGSPGDGGPTDGAASVGSAGSGGTTAGGGGATAGEGGAGGATSGAAGATAGAAGAAGGGMAGASGAAGSNVPVGDSVLMHHRNPSHDGLYVQPTFTKAALAALAVDAGFTATLPDPNDQVYAQPLFVDGGAGGQNLLIVATEGNNVYALDAATGAVVWTKNLGAPVPLTTMSCGNIDRYGVTGTPVIDLASRRLFATAAVLPASGVPTYEIFALSLADGSIVTGWPIDVPTAVSATGTFTAKTQGQRGGLALVGGTLYVPFGGLFGDCPPFHGWIVAVPIDAPASVKAWTTPAAGGGLWAPGGLASDGTSLFASTGNTYDTTTWGGGDAVLRFGTGAAFGAPADSFAPMNWHMSDLFGQGSGAAPVLFTLPGATPSALVISFQLDGNAYLLDQAHLGGVGMALGSTGVGPSAFGTLHVSTALVISAPAVYTTATATYVTFKAPGAGCPGGKQGTVTTLKVTPGAPPTLAVAWCAGVGDGSPMVTTSNGKDDAVVWMPGAEDNNRLQAFDGDTGAPLAFAGSTTTITGMRRYNAPIAAKGRVYVAHDGGVTAFKLP